MPTADLRLALAQTSLHWQQPEANMAMLEEQLSPLAGQVDLVVLPEMFTTGFTMEAAKIADPLGYRTHKWMAMMAARTKAVICGSVVVSEGGAFYNRMLVVYPEGQVLRYDKRHLFRMADEHLTYSPGTERLVFRIGQWRICPLICYDLRFPVWSRNVPEAYDLLLYVANWPSPRAHGWNTLLPARAIENQTYVAAVNRTGTDGNGHPYQGDSQVLDFLGNSVLQAKDKDGIYTATISLVDLGAFRTRFPAGMDADQFAITV